MNEFEGGWETGLQRQPSVAPGDCVHGAWHEAFIGSPSSTAASMTGIERASVIQLADHRLLRQLVVECPLHKGSNSHCRP